MSFDVSVLKGLTPYLTLFDMLTECVKLSYTRQPHTRHMENSRPRDILWERDNQLLRKLTDKSLLVYTMSADGKVRTFALSLLR